MGDIDERVRHRAYRLWMEEGCPDGRSDVHWQKARELVAIEDNQKLTTKRAPDPERPGGEPVEPLEVVENTGEFPTMTDQGEEQAAPKRRAAAAQAKRPLKSEAAKPQAAVRPKAAAPARSKSEATSRAKPSRSKGR